MFQQVHTQHFKRGNWPFHIDDSETLVEHGQHRSLQVFCVRQVHDAFPFGIFALLHHGCGIGFVKTCFLAVDFFVSERFCLLDELDKVVILENSPVRMHFDRIHVFCLFHVNLAA